MVNFQSQPRAFLSMALMCLALTAWRAEGSGPPPSTKPSSASIALTNLPPKVEREFRGAWIATYSNIDWPSKPGLPVQQQKDELRALMDKAAEFKLNAIVFQVRPVCDAFYASSIEPWSYYLTGQMGKAPAAGFDPLQYAIDLAHARGMELHAWFNPYRAGLVTSSYSARHITRAQPRLVKRYDKYLWLDPSEPAVQDYTTRVIMDVVKRYDIDGVHLDDYFYPYPEKDARGAMLDFPDDANWARYRNAGGKLSRPDWRRENVNKMVSRLRREIGAAKSYVTFGISPFGIWRPGFPEQIKGLDAYDHVFADSRHWLTNAWVDFLAPQLYWTIDRPETSYSALLDWWRQQDGKGAHIWPGGAPYKVASRAWNWPATEIARQIELTRTAESPGYIHFTLSSIASGPDTLRGALQNIYAEPALVPVNRGDTGDVPKPVLNAARDSSGKQHLHWSVPPSQRVAFWVVQTRTGEKWRTQILPAHQREMVLASLQVNAVAVSFLSRHRNLSPVALRTF